MPCVRRVSAMRVVMLMGSVCACGCATMNHTESGAVLGTGLGTAVGAVIGSQAGSPGAGALVGAGVGALAGSMIGSAEDAHEEMHAMQAAQAQQAYHAAHAMTNQSLVQMSQNKVGEEVILGAIRQQGGQFDLTPSAIISMKGQGVSERVIQYVQEHSRMQAGSSMSLVDGAGSGVVSGPTYVYAEPRVRAGVFVSPGPAVYVGPGPGWHGPRRW